MGKETSSRIRHNLNNWEIKHILNNEIPLVSKHVVFIYLFVCDLGASCQ